MKNTCVYFFITPDTLTEQHNIFEKQGENITEIIKEPSSSNEPTTDPPTDPQRTPNGPEIPYHQKLFITQGMGI